MRNAKIFLAAVVWVFIGGCASMHADAGAPNALPRSISYTCADGRVVQATYPDTNTAQIKIANQTYLLHVAMSADGARYTGDGWQWWTKGMHDANLAPLAAGETIASAASVACHAP